MSDRTENFSVDERVIGFGEVETEPDERLDTTTSESDPADRDDADKDSEGRRRFPRGHAAKKTDSRGWSGDE